MKKLNQLGFEHVTAMVIVVVLFAIVGVGYIVASKALSPASTAAQTAFRTAGTAMCNSLPSSTPPITVKACQELQKEDSTGNPAAWALSQSVSATLDVGLNTPGSVRVAYASTLLNMFAPYTEGRPYSGGLTPYPNKNGTIYYDDDAWVALDLIQAYHQSGKKELLTAAEQIWQFEQTGRYDPAHHPSDSAQCGNDCHPGGIYWNTERINRPTHVAALYALLGLQLYQIDGDKSKLLSAGYEYNWVRSNLNQSSSVTAQSSQAKSNTKASLAALYQDHITPLGKSDPGPTDDYKQAIMIEDGQTLYQITHNLDYLKQSVATAQAAIKHNGIVWRELHQCPAFNAILFYELQKLQSAVPGIGRSTLAAYDSWASSVIDPNTGALPTSLNVNYHVACEKPLPQAGATRALIIQTTGL